MSSRNDRIHGAGAIGSVIAARLAAGGARVGLVARGAHLQALQAHGLRLQGATDGRFDLPASDHARDLDLDENTVVVLAMKTGDTAAALDTHLELYEDLPIVCSQNGVTNEQLVLDRNLTPYGCTVMVGAAIHEPGLVWHSGGELLSLGVWPTGTDAVVEAVVSDLLAGSMKARSHEDIRANKWGKLVRNLANAYLALTDLSVQEASCEEADRFFIADVQEEALDALDAAGIEIESIGRRSPREQLENMRSPGTWKPQTGGSELVRSFPSTWQDLSAGRTTVEVDHFNGTIVRLGEEHGVATPLNRVLRDQCVAAAQQRRGVGSETTASLRAGAT